MNNDDFLDVGVHNEFEKRIDREIEQQNHRIDRLEETVDKINRLAASTEKLADNMQNMLKEQEKQGQRLSALENRDGKKWQETVKIVGSAIVGALITFLTQILLK